MTEKIIARGKIEVAPAVIASIVSEAVQTCYGVVGTVPRNFATGLVEQISTDRKRGVEVIVQDGEITIALFVVMEYGTRISTVAKHKTCCEIPSRKNVGATCGPGQCSRAGLTRK